MGEGIIFSIIIPFKKWSPYLDECLTHIQQLKFKFYEVILLPDGELEIPRVYNNINFQVISTGEINPALKRDQGAEKALGKYLAFLDDDAYPRYDWLDVAESVFLSQKDVGAIGGPGVTPNTDSYWARVSGAVFLSPISGGFPERYVPIPPYRSVDDWPSVNLIVRKSVFDQIEGFDSNYWPGEDTLFCLKIIRDTSFKIMYVPDLLVWHHRRPGLQKHLRQVGNYGMHRGYFTKIYPETSRRFKFFIPALWLIFVLAGPACSFLFSWAWFLYLMGWGAYLVAIGFCFRDILRHEPAWVVLGAAPYILLTHLWYGTKFIQGLTTQTLQSSLGR